MKFEYIYILFSWDFPMRGTLGVAPDVETRRLDMQATLSSILSRDVTVRVIWKMPVATHPAYDIETAIHRALHPLRCTSIPGSGRTFWYWIPNLVTALVSGLLMWGFGVTEPTIRAMFLLLLPVPIDFALCVTLLALVEYSIAITILIFGWRILQTLLQTAFL
jgi:hypothetical protein